MIHVYNNMAKLAQATHCLPYQFRYVNFNRTSHNRHRIKHRLSIKDDEAALSDSLASHALLIMKSPNKKSPGARNRPSRELPSDLHPTQCQSRMRLPQSSRSTSRALSHRGGKASTRWCLAAAYRQDRGSAGLHAAEEIEALRRCCVYGKCDSI